MAALAKPFHHMQSVMSTEALAIKEAIFFCLQAGFNGGELLSDFPSFD